VFEMPIYEYRCTACGHELEALQKFSDEPLKNCPECSQGSLQKLVSSTSFQLKGTGWYATDFRDKGKPPKPAVQSEGSGSAESKPADAKVETKSAETKDTKSTDSSTGSS